MPVSNGQQSSAKVSASSNIILNNITDKQKGADKSSSSASSITDKSLSKNLSNKPNLMATHKKKQGKNKKN